MPNETITSLLTTIYRLHDSDNLYISPTGGILFSSSSAAALANNGSLDKAIDIIVDGSVVGLSGPAISLASSVSSDIGNDSILIGATGVVRSVAQTAISLNRSNEILINHGAISGGTNGVAVTGTNTEIINNGSISGVNSGVQVTGLGTSLVNHGTISGKRGIDAQGLNTTIENYGAIQATFSAGVSQTLTHDSGLINAGDIVSSGSSAVFVTLLGETGTYNLTNTGVMHGVRHALELGFLTTTGFNVHIVAILNDGEMIGHDSAISIGATDSNTRISVVNTENGTISSGSGPAAIEFSDSIRIVNHGTISNHGLPGTGEGAITGLGGTGSVNAISVTIVNTGTISSTDHAINIFANQSDLTSLRLVNSGDIVGDVLGSRSSNTIINSGSMEGMTLSAANDIVRNRGLIEGSITLSVGSDLVDTRQGLITGTVSATGSGNDTMLGGLGDDRFRASDGNDVLRGGDGDDFLMGGLGRDLVRGGDGDDTICGDLDFDTPPGAASSADTLFGGNGADVFVYVSTAYFGNTGATRDRIADFSTAEDKIQLTAFMAGGKFIGTANFSATGAKEVRFSASSNLLVGDVNGDGAFDWQIGVNSGLTFTADNFIF